MSDFDCFRDAIKHAIDQPIVAAMSGPIGTQSPQVVFQLQKQNECRDFLLGAVNEFERLNAPRKVRLRPANGTEAEAAGRADYERATRGE